MNPVSLSSERWSSARWWATLLFALGVQLGLVLWLGERGPARERPAVPGPMLQLAGSNSREVLALADPTLFALPHREGFSGPAWLSAPSQEIQPFTWTEPNRFLELPAEQLAASLSASAGVETAGRLPTPAGFQPDLLLAPVNEPPLFPDHSTVRAAGGLQGRALRTRFELPSWPHADVLRNSVVQVLVDPGGTPFSAILLGSGSGSKEADDFAVRQARAARFAPLPRGASGDQPLSGLVWGELIFEWHTVPATNTPAQKP